MGIIQCAENCKYQKEGYCTLDKPSPVNSVLGGCPYYIKKSFDEGDCLGKPSDTDKLNIFRSGSDLF